MERRIRAANYPEHISIIVLAQSRLASKCCPMAESHCFVVVLERRLFSQGKGLL